MSNFLSLESLSSSGRDTGGLSLRTLQSKMKCDPEGYESELLLLYRHFDSSLQVFHQQSALDTSSHTDASNELGEMTMFLAHVTPFYPGKLDDFPLKIADFLRNDASMLPFRLRSQLAQALILLVNRKIISIEQTLELFMHLQTINDRIVRKLAFSHVIQSIRRMNKKHKNEATNRKLQNILFSILQEEDEVRAKRSLVVLCDLHRRKVWFGDRVANSICTACFHPSSRIMISALSFLLQYEQFDDYEDSDGSSSEDDSISHKPQIILSRGDVYKSQHQGTISSKKKKKAKMQRVIRSMKKQDRASSENTISSSYTPLTHLNDPQGFAEKLFSRLQRCNEKFKVKMMMLKVTARTIGLHRLVVLNFYPFLQKYAQPHQDNVTNILAAAAQACHDMVPTDAVQPLLRHIVDHFVHDRSRTEAIAVGLNVVREICLRIPLLMTEDLLQDLVLYKKSHEKAVSTAARSLITLFREINPSLLIKKDRGRPINPKAKPKEFGEVSIASNVPGFELLDEEDESSGSDDGEDNEAMHDAVADGEDNDDVNGSEDDLECSDGDNQFDVGYDDVNGSEDVLECSDDDNIDIGDGVSNDNKEDIESSDDDISMHDIEQEEDAKRTNAKKRKFVDFGGLLDSANTSLRSLRRLAVTKDSHDSDNTPDGILSNEDFQRIKELKAKKDLKTAMFQHRLLKKGSDPKQASLKIPSSEKLSAKRLDASKLEAHIKMKMNKEQRLELVKAGREDRGKYQARAAVKQKKTGGLSNRQKEHKKVMPFAAKKSKVKRSRVDKRKKSAIKGKQFRGKKAWK